VILFSYDIGETYREIVQWTIIGFIMLGFATNIISILYNTISFIIKNVKKNKSQTKVGIEPEIDEDRYTFSNIEVSMTQMTFSNKENSFYSKLNRRNTQDSQIIE
jgi:hypothetical protein